MVRKRQGERKTGVLVIEPEDLKEGACTIKKASTGEDWGICVEEGVITLKIIGKEG